MFSDLWWGVKYLPIDYMFWPIASVGMFSCNYGLSAEADELTIAIQVYWIFSIHDKNFVISGLVADIVVEGYVCAGEEWW